MYFYTSQITDDTVNKIFFLIKLIFVVLRQCADGTALLCIPHDIVVCGSITDTCLKAKKPGKTSSSFDFIRSTKDGSAHSI